VAAVHRELSQVAGDDELRPGDLATTLLVAMVTEHHTVVAQVGDGAIVGAFDGSEPVALTRPWHGDFINETCFVTQDDYLANAQIHVFEGAARHVALFSDGLESVALQWATGEVMRPLFARLFEFMTATPCAEIRREAVRRLLEQGPVAARSDDDKALVLATRGPSHQVTGS
jgi:hypothetical protein